MIEGKGGREGNNKRLCFAHNNMNMKNKKNDNNKSIAQSFFCCKPQKKTWVDKKNTVVFIIQYLTKTLFYLLLLKRVMGESAKIKIASAIFHHESWDSSFSLPSQHAWVYFLDFDHTSNMTSFTVTLLLFAVANSLYASAYTSDVSGFPL